MEFPSDSRDDVLPPGWHSFHRRREDRPFDSRLTLRDGYDSKFGLTPCSKPRQHHARRCVLANLLYLRGGQWCFYSRDNNHYAELGRYASDFYSRRWMVEQVDDLAMSDLIEHDRTSPSPSAQYRSRMRPTDRFLDLASAIPAEAVLFAPAEVIVLRDENRSHMDYAETHLTRRMRADVVEQNEFLAGVDIGIEHLAQVVDAQGFLLLNGSRVAPSRTNVHRVFNGTFGKGGRFYGPWWQNLPRETRQALLIRGEATIEKDIPCCHPRLLLAAQGRELGSDDFYARVDGPRSEVKLAVNMMLNAASRRGAVAALRQELKPVHGSTAHKRAADLRQAVEKTFPELSAFWNKGVGLVLQNIDAQICAWILQRLRRANVACLSIHDSFIVQVARHRALREVMQDALERACNSLRKNGLLVGPMEIF